ncbi:MAG: hypothetical protein HUJ98_08135, partial [Bacteroidaceae bacterium]|nr:hypothetical protein [Bacteroidaceae bacterium]
QKEQTELESHKSNKHGDLRKCPNCGTAIPPLVAKCPECNFEFRNVGVSNFIQDFLNKIQKAEGGRRETEAIIENYPIPNSKDDLFEMLSIILSNIDKGTDFINMRTAYHAKYEEIKTKIEILFPGEPIFQGLFEKYEKYRKSRKSQQIFRVLFALLGAIPITWFTWHLYETDHPWWCGIVALYFCIPSWMYVFMFIYNYSKI